MVAQGMREPMPSADEPGWHTINAGSHLTMMFHPNRQLAGREQDGNVRRTIVVALAGQEEQSLRFDPFDLDPHYHIRPVRGEGQIPLEVAEGQNPLEATLAWFERQPYRFRDLLGKAENVEVAMLVTNVSLANAAHQIRWLNDNYERVAA
jgi:hypothetical protein